jgi:hypothetical protein
MRRSCLVNDLVATAVWGLAVAVTTAGCTDQASSRAKEQLAALEKKKVEQAKVVKPQARAAQLPHVGGPYDETQATVLTPDSRCPESLWALFPGEAPGSTPDEKRANELRRAELARTLSAKPFVVLLQAPARVTLHPHDAVNGRFLIDVAGEIDCIDSGGHVTIAWTKAMAIEAPASAISRGSEVLPNIWQAPAVSFELPMKGLTEAKSFYDANRFGVSARVAITLKKGEIDQKLKKVGKVSKEMPDQTLAYGGGVEDWGAGRLVRANLVGVRVAADQEQKELFDRRGPN